MKHLVYLAIVAGTIAMMGCGGVASPKLAAAPAPAGPPGSSGPSGIGATPPVSAAPSGGAPVAVAPGAGGGGAAPILPAVTNIVFEVTTRSRSTDRSAKFVALPAIDGTRQESTVIVPSVTVAFPTGFAYTKNATYDQHEWAHREEVNTVNTLTSIEWDRATVVVTYSLDAGATWSSELENPNGYFHTRPTWGRDASGGWVKLTVESPGVENRLTSELGDWDQSHACKTSLSTSTVALDQTITVTFKEGAATATAMPRLLNGVVTGVYPDHEYGTLGTVTHVSGTFSDASAVTATWNAPFGETQRGTGATFTPTIVAGKISAVAIATGGTGYLQPCQKLLSGCAGSGGCAPHQDFTTPSYWLVARLKHYLTYYGSSSILVRFAIISP